MFYLSKFNSSGDVEWANTLGGSDTDRATSVQETSDGGYVVTGYSESFGIYGKKDIFLLTVDQYGQSVLKDGCGIYWVSVSDAFSNIFLEITPQYWSFEYWSDVEYHNSSLASYADYFSAEVVFVGENINRTLDCYVYRECFGIYSGKNGLGPNLCSGHGICVTNSTCECFPNYFGIECHIQKCGGIFSNESEVCYGRGSCVDTDKCESCVDDYFGDECELRQHASFVSYIGGIDPEGSFSVQQARDGGFIVSGFTRSFGAGGSDALLLKFFSNGSLDWATSFGESVYEYGHFVQQTFDGGYIVTGDRDTYGAADLLLAKFFSNGLLDWAYTFDVDGGRDVGHAIQQTTDGGYIVTGKTQSGGNQLLLSKFHSDGSLDWAVSVGGPAGVDIGHSVQQTTDGGYIVAGETASFGSGIYDLLLIKFDSDGVVDWAITLGGSQVDKGYSVQQTTDGGYIVCGKTESFGKGGEDVLLAKFSKGVLDWATTLGGSQNDYGKSVQQTTDGDYIVTGLTSSFGLGENAVFLAKYHANGSLNWVSHFGGNFEDEGSSVQQTFDGGFVITGSTNSFGAGGDDLFLAKVYSDGEGCVDFVRMDSDSLLFDFGFIDSIFSDPQYLVADVVTSTITPVLRTPTIQVNETIGDQLFVEESCSIEFSCFGTSVESKVCNGRGNCTGHSHCICGSDNIKNERYFGEECEGQYCFGILFNDTDNVCGSHGVCVDFDNCECDIHYDYVGDCSRWKCFGKWDNDSNVCNGNLTSNVVKYIPEHEISHGNCTSHDYCVCEEDGYLETPQCDWECFGDPNYEESTCNGEFGVCIDHDVCNCTQLDVYSGERCHIPSCASILGSDYDNVCSGHGKCDNPDVCECDTGYASTIPGLCDWWACGGIFWKNNDSCHGHGNCTGDNNCECEEGYESAYYCGNWKCEDIDKDDSQVCNDHGECIFSEVCDCDEGYNSSKPGYCDMWNCGGIDKDDGISVCNGHGECAEFNVCDCEANYFTEIPGYCDSWNCEGIHWKDEDSVCNGHGKCDGFNLCSCKNGYEGTYCETWKCGDIDKGDSQVCSGKGICEKPKKCKCDIGFKGSVCETNTLLLTVMVPVLSFAGFVTVVFFSGLVCLCGCCCLLVCCLSTCLLGCLLAYIASQMVRWKRFGKLKNIDILLQEQEAEDNTSIAHIRINKKLFEIPYQEIKITKILGEGGSSSVVYLATWHNKKTAFKCFKTRNICSNQDSFDEFEKEVEVFSNISHPNIVAFYGCTMDPPRVGILMEFCEKGEVHQYIIEYDEKNDGVRYPMAERFRMLAETAGAMNYLHSKNIVHRDLKCENVLLDKSEECKVMDFGLAKVSDRLSQKQTKMIGTAFYSLMAPEVTAGKETYNEKCDVFSFSIMCWILITGDQYPYGNDSGYNVELKVSQDEFFRPDVKFMKHFLREDEMWIIKQTQKCWDHDPQKRPSFHELSVMFEEKKNEEKDKEESVGVVESTDEVAHISQSAIKIIEEEEEVDEERRRAQMISVEDFKKVEKELDERSREVDVYKKDIESLRETIQQLEGKKNSED